MKPINEMKLTFQSRSINEGFSRVAVGAFICGLDPTLEELADIRTAVSEAVTNAIVHAYKESIKPVYISVTIFSDSRVVIKIRDRGCGIPDIKRAMEPMFTTCTNGERAGLGFAVMQSVCDKVKVRSTVGKGTCVTLEKHIASRGAADV